jgi:hypothetical protein
MITPRTEEDHRQLSLLMTPAGEPGSGHTRYAAAMYFYTRGMITAETLETFRILAPLDNEAPDELLRDLGLNLPG